MSLRSITAAASLMLFGASATALAAETPLPTPGTMSATPQASMCNNAPGPFITLNGELALEEINGRLIFRNNKKGTHEASEDVTVDVVLLNEGETIQFAKQPPLGGVGGESWVSAMVSTRPLREGGTGGTHGLALPSRWRPIISDWAATIPG